MKAIQGSRSRLAIVLLAIVAVLTSGCRIEASVALDVDRDGSGLVSVAVALDEEAAARVPQLADQLEVDDLVTTGWTVTGPALEADGRTWIRATKPFASPEQAGLVLDEVSGAGGPFRDLAIHRSPTLLRDTWEFTGTADLGPGLAAFSDEALRERLDGTYVGVTDEEIAAAEGRPLTEVFTFEVAVTLPGEISSNGIEGGDRRAVWQPQLGEQLVLVATGSRLNGATVVWLVVAGAALVALVVLLAIRARRWRATRHVRSDIPSAETG